jgi:hypothetical protein
MRILLRIVAILFVIIAAVLVYSVISVASDDGSDLRVGVAIAYVVGAILLLAGAVALWRRPAPGAGPV